MERLHGIRVGRDAHNVVQQSSARGGAVHGQRVDPRKDVALCEQKNAQAVLVLLVLQSLVAV